MKISIFGYGWVGKSVKELFKDAITMLTNTSALIRLLSKIVIAKNVKETLTK
jgi:homoserine dehydrogenase